MNAGQVVLAWLGMLGIIGLVFGLPAWLVQTRRCAPLDTRRIYTLGMSARRQPAVVAGRDLAVRSPAPLPAGPVRVGGTVTSGTVDPSVAAGAVAGARFVVATRRGDQPAAGRALLDLADAAGLHTPGELPAGRSGRGWAP